MHELVDRLAADVIWTTNTGPNEEPEIRSDPKRAAELIRKQAAEIAEHDAITERQNALIRKQAERFARLEKALRPFAALASEFDGNETCDPEADSHEFSGFRSCAVGHLRIARQALSPEEDE